MLTFSFANRHKVIVLNDEGHYELQYSGDLSLPVFMEIQRTLSDIDFKITKVDGAEFERTMQHHFSQGSQELGSLGNSLDGSEDFSTLIEQMDEPEDLLESDDDAPIIKLLNALFTEAIKKNASDIHVESYEQRTRIRFRIDGVMSEVMEPNRKLAPQLISRIKVMAKLDIAEKRMPQDGRISLKLGGRSVDLRISTLPSATGERVVMRLLDKKAGSLELEHLGMPAHYLEQIDELIRNPYGIILVTGPTGSGKTTSLYASLIRLNDHQRNIMTVEDPIEYHIDGINQTQTNTKIDMTFARGLRAILRQDPDIVMIGEIRDTETAQIAVQASLTGHLVLSTLHTNTAVGAITRLRDMSVESFLLSSSLLVVISQRLTRRLCHKCREAYEPTSRELDALQCPPLAEGELFYRPHAKGCGSCNFTGYQGRTGIYELLPIDDVVRKMIHEEASEEVILEHVRKKYPSLREEGIRLIKEGETSVEEVLRVIQNLGER